METCCGTIFIIHIFRLEADLSIRVQCRDISIFAPHAFKKKLGAEVKDNFTCFKKIK